MNNNEIKDIENLFNKYNLINTIPKDVEKKISKSERKNYVKLLKKTGNYSIFIAVSTYIVYLLKKSSVIFTTIKSSVILSTTTVVSVTTITTGIYFGYKAYYQEKPEEVIPATDNTKIIEEIAPKTVTPEIATPAKPIVSTKLPENRIAIQPLKTINIDSEVAKNITFLLNDNLEQLRGKNSSLIQNKDSNNKNVTMILKGDVNSSNDQIVINIKILNIKNLEYIFYTTETVKNKDQIENACQKISRQIVDNIK